MVALEPNTLSIVCASCVFMITCQNIDLTELEEALHDEQVYRLQPFNAKLFDAPDEGTAVITNIMLQDKRSAPVNQNAKKKAVKAPPELVEARETLS